MSSETPQSGTNSKRPSPPTASSSAPKRVKGNNEEGGEGSQNNSGSGPSVPGPSMDPDQLSDALLSAGVDLKEEENLLSSSLTTEQQYTRAAAVQGTTPARTSPAVDFLNSPKLLTMVRKIAAEAGVRHVFDKDNEITRLLSVSCQEWLTDIITSMVVLNRHRRRSRNDVHSDISRALRNLAVKDKEAEDRRLAQKAVMGSESGQNGEDKKNAVSEETQYRAANATALMMTGKKKYSWLTGGSSSPGMRSSGGLPRNEGNIRYREAREEPNLALRDLLGALEERRFGVEKTLVKGYAKLKN
ncbi:hypothetical protein TRICI_006732 [Trichomonascus ciferrii]|uniref:Transcription initiation factor TFIID subunit 4 n=1 Tax=Trichomonascus ciferrii TaxID=44093 RepID=A0A642UE67_9ASCO|nr:hypothetical protein TRICI_006732 [Trichomonascus ciferrii]